MDTGRGTVERGTESSERKNIISPILNSLNDYFNVFNHSQGHKNEPILSFIAKIILCNYNLSIFSKFNHFMSRKLYFLLVYFYWLDFHSRPQISANQPLYKIPPHLGPHLTPHDLHLPNRVKVLVVGVPTAQTLDVWCRFLL